MVSAIRPSGATTRMRENTVLLWSMSHDHADIPQAGGKVADEDKTACDLPAIVPIARRVRHSDQAAEQSQPDANRQAVTASLRKNGRCLAVFVMTPERTNQAPSRNIPIRIIAKAKSLAAFSGNRPARHLTVSE